jgi:hypothetical protein
MQREITIDVVCMGGFLVPKPMVGVKASGNGIGSHCIKAPGDPLVWIQGVFAAGGRHQTHPANGEWFSKWSERNVPVVGPGVGLYVTLGGVILPATINVTDKRTVGSTLIHMEISNKGFSEPQIKDLVTRRIPELIYFFLYFIHFWKTYFLME